MKPVVKHVSVLGGKYTVHTELFFKPQHEKSIILVNGVMSTTKFFSQTVKYLSECVNVILFDLPFLGQSRNHNQGIDVLTKSDEVEILKDLIKYFQCEYLMAVSWGSVASLLTLSENPPELEKAIIVSFSPTLNDPMVKVLKDANAIMDGEQRHLLGDLINDTVGYYMPPVFKRLNCRHFSNLTPAEFTQINFYLRQIFTLYEQKYDSAFANINIPVLFLNGEFDEYTTPAGAQYMQSLVSKAEFGVIKGAGHFLDLENQPAWEQMRSRILGFLTANQQGYRSEDGLISQVA